MTIYMCHDFRKELVRPRPKNALLQEKSQNSQYDEKRSRRRRRWRRLWDKNFFLFLCSLLLLQTAVHSEWNKKKGEWDLSNWGWMKETKREKKFEIFNDQHYCDCSVQCLVATAQQQQQQQLRQCLAVNEVEVNSRLYF